MKAPLKWLSDFADINVSPKEYADAMTMSGSKVEGFEEMASEISNIVLGKIMEIVKHPDADKLQICTIDAGKGNLQIVTGAQNVKVGCYIPVALDGSVLPGGKKIKKGKLRGVESNGMLCSVEELGYTKYDFPDAAEDGIYLISEAMLKDKFAEKDIDKELLGTDIRTVLGIDDTVVEFEITPNRPDCLSIVGLARETGATLSTSFREPKIQVAEKAPGKAEDSIKVEIKDSSLCPRYAARVIRNVKISESPWWMKERLRAAGIRSINNIVDITNYVMIEMGQPMHAYDLDNLKGSKIIVRQAQKGEELETLDGSKRALDENMIVIADEDRAVGVAGVMGGGNSEVTGSTKSILFESALFDGTSIRITSKKLGLRTEASSRFEKGLDVENSIKALNRAAELIEMLNAGEVEKGVVDCYPVHYKERVIELQEDRINALLGTDIPRERMASMLETIGLKYDKANNTVTIPSFRGDIEGMADLAEEVARFYGYNNITPSLINGKEATIGIKTFKQKLENKVKDTMTSCGLYEIYTFSFTSPDIFNKIRIPEDSDLRKAVVISNPLGVDYSVMRTTTIPEMLNVISRNYNRRVPEGRLFELSYVYKASEKRVNEVKGIDESNLPKEVEVLTLGMYGKVDFYDLKGAVEELFSVIGVTDYSFEKETDNPTYHPNRTASIIVGGKKAGTIGEIHPDVLENFDIDTKAYAGTVELETLAANCNGVPQYKSLPKFPAVSRDIAMVIDDEVMVSQIEAVIRQRGGKTLEEITLFDVYKGKQVQEGMKSVAYSITFRAEDRTLTDEDVSKAMHKIVDGLRTNLNAELRE